MELMSSLLFCALFAHLPQAFAEFRPGAEIKFNNTMEIHQKPLQKKVVLVKMVNDLQSVFSDLSCERCIDCMERAIKAYKSHYQIFDTISDTETLHEQALRLKSYNRGKRESGSITTEKTTTKTRRTKSKKRASKSISVTKYHVDGDVFALKVKETNLSSSDSQMSDTTSCQVFSVKKSFPCDTAEGESLVTVAKRKVDKKKRDKDVSKSSSSKPHFMAPAFRKRQVDNSQIPDNFMPSIEDLY